MDRPEPCPANGSFPPYPPRKLSFSLRPDCARPRRSRCLMLRSKPDIRSVSGLRLLEALLEQRNVIGRRKIVRPKADIVSACA